MKITLKSCYFKKLYRFPRKGNDVPIFWRGVFGFFARSRLRITFSRTERPSKIFTYVGMQAGCIRYRGVIYWLALGHCIRFSNRTRTNKIFYRPNTCTVTVTRDTTVNLNEINYFTFSVKVVRVKDYTRIVCKMFWSDDDELCIMKFECRSRRNLLDETC